MLRVNECVVGGNFACTHLIHGFVLGSQIPARSDATPSWLAVDVAMFVKYADLLNMHPELQPPL